MKPYVRSVTEIPNEVRTIVSDRQRVHTLNLKTTELLMCIEWENGVHFQNPRTVKLFAFFCSKLALSKTNGDEHDHMSRRNGMG